MASVYGPADHPSPKTSRVTPWRMSLCERPSTMSDPNAHDSMLMNPGATARPRASTSSVPLPSTRPTALMRSPSIARSPSNGSPPPPSTIVPPRMTTSGTCARAPWGRARHRRDRARPACVANVSTMAHASGPARPGPRFTMGRRLVTARQDGARGPALERPPELARDPGARSRDRVELHARLDAAPPAEPQQVLRRQVAAHAETGVLGATHDRTEHRDGRVPRAIEVLARVGLAGGPEDGDLGRAGGERPLEAGLVRDEHGIADSRPAPERAQDLRGVGQLGHRVRAHEGSGLDDRDARVREPLDEAHLRLGGEDAFLALQPVARTHLHDCEASRQPDHAESLSKSTSFCPRSTASPTLTRTPRTTPGAGALTGSSIFMASTITSTAPRSTRWPAVALTATTTPGSGAARSDA